MPGTQRTALCLQHQTPILAPRRQERKELRLVYNPKFQRPDLSSDSAVVSVVKFLSGFLGDLGVFA
ncbi:MAG: hypothetical protein ABIL58_02485 [Pseudomonadota bacterium]